MKCYLFVQEKNRIFQSGWHDPIGPEIVEDIFNKKFRTTNKKSDHPLYSLEFSDPAGVILNEDLYPLV